MTTTTTENTSGHGQAAVVPAEIMGWNWGAFLLHWIWSIGNSVWIGLIALVSPATLVMAIILGIKGSEWAWRARRWESVEHFKRTQRQWTIAGIIVWVVAAAITLLVILTLGMFTIFQSA